ncbi:MAG: serpin family protein [Chloroflexota bacterium]
MLKRIGLCMLLLLPLLIVAGCEAPVQEERAGVVRAEEERISEPQVGEDDLDALVEGNSAFAFDLYRFLAKEEDNLFYSPYSISLALAMTHAGARGETEAQMADVLHFTLPQEELHPAFNALDLALASRGEEEEEGFRLHVVNALWGQKGYEFLSEFLRTLAENYGAGLRVLDFATKPEESRVTINDWVAEETEERIEDLLPKNAIDRSTVLVLTNAIYFNAAWQHPFQEEQTEDGTFYLRDGEEVTVPMMNQTESFAYGEGEGYQALELPYEDEELSMVILLPKEGGFEEFEGTLDAGRVEAIVQDMTRTSVNITMPKFSHEWDTSLKETLSALGMPVAFSSGADFSGMTGSRGLFIDDVIHKAFVAVDEEGTEAAAATAVIMRESAPLSPVEFTVDHPFIFLIRDRETGTILFVGRVMDPSA